ncbi:MAG: redoxin domain-containing protein [Bacteroidetes bacterium]|nr:redoxin domain-containing protein [Bacteroidota bacterium]
MKNLILLFVLSISTLNAFCQGNTKPVLLSIDGSAPMADEPLQNTQGGNLTLTQAKRENGLIVIFSCNSCPFVVGTPDFPGWEKQYNALYDQALKYNVGLVLVNSNEGKRTGADSFDEMKKRANEQNYMMPYLLDKNSKMADLFSAKTTPHVYYFNKEMRLVYMGSIDNIADNKRKKDIPYLSMAMQAEANGKKCKPNKTAPVGCSIKRIKKD